MITRILGMPDPTASLETYLHVTAASATEHVMNITQNASPKRASVSAARSKRVRRTGIYS